MGKKLLIVMTVLFCISSAGLGYAGYQAAVETGEQGAVLKELRWIVPLTKEYTFIEEAGLDGQYYSARLDDTGSDSALLNDRGEAVDQVRWDSVYGEGDSYIFTKGGNMGYKSLDGRVIIPAKFDAFYGFDGDYALAVKDDRYAAVDRKGEIVYRFAEGEDVFVNRVEGNYFGEEQGERYRIIDVSDGRVVKTWNSVYCRDVEKCGQDIYRAEGICGPYFLDENFDVAFDGKLFESNTCKEYSEGLAYAEWIVNGNWKDCPNKKEVRPGYIDEQGDMVIETPGSIYGGAFSCGKALIYGTDKVWCIDSKGKKLFEVPLKKRMVLDAFDNLNSTLNLSFYILPGCRFTGGAAPLYDGEKMGLINETGNWIIEPVFDDVDIFSGNRIAVEYRGKWGVFHGESMIRKAGS